MARLHQGEEFLRERAVDVVAADDRLGLHLQAIERAMDLLDLLREFEGSDEDIKVVQALGMRMFNAFGASVKLALSGYSQQAALIMRDILETSFLLDLFSRDRTAIERWRSADRKKRMRDFKPVKVRELLDERDKFTTKKRAAHYELLSELAGHPSMPSLAMLRPMGMDPQIGPFIDQTVVEAVIADMAKLAIQAGVIVIWFLPPDWNRTDEARSVFSRMVQRWLEVFQELGGERGTPP